MSLPEIGAPYWLVLAALPFVMDRWRRRPSMRGRPVVEPGLEGWSIRRPDPVRSRSAWLIAWFALVTALADPVVGPSGDRAPARVVDLATVIDISPSMAAGDLAPSRLAQAAREWRALAQRLPPARTSLTAYSAESYPLLPLTTDLGIVADYLDELSPTMTRRTGSNLVQALETAAGSLAGSPAGGRALLVLSDGEVHAAGACEAIARRFRREGLPIFVLGIGTGRPVPIDDGTGRLLRDPETGRVHLTRLNATTLERIARLSGGAYVTATADAGDTRALVRSLSGLEAHPLDGATAATGTRLAPWAIALAIACLVMTLWSPVRAAPYKPHDGL